MCNACKHLRFAGHYFKFNYLFVTNTIYLLLFCLSIQECNLWMRYKKTESLINLSAVISVVPFSMFE